MQCLLILPHVYNIRTEFVVLKRGFTSVECQQLSACLQRCGTLKHIDLRPINCTSVCMGAELGPSL